MPLIALVAYFESHAWHLRVQNFFGSVGTRHGRFSSMVGMVKAGTHQLVGSVGVWLESGGVGHSETIRAERALSTAPGYCDEFKF